MVEFLGRYGLKAIAVLTEPSQYGAYRAVYGDRLSDYFVDEFLATEFPNIDALAHRILHDAPGKLEGIIPWAELTIDFGALLGEKLGIDWNPYYVIRRFRNKFEMKEALRAHGGVRVNASQVVNSIPEVMQFIAPLSDWPVVVKPSEGAGSTSVFFAHSIEELIDACNKVFQSDRGEVLLEEYISGNEFVVNGITDSRGQMLVTDVWRYDKRDVGPHKNIYFQTMSVPSFDPVWAPLATYATQVVHALGLRRAPVHMELKLEDRGPCLVEVGARFAGGNQPLLASELHGRSLFELAACHYLSEGIVRWEDVHYDRYNAHRARIVSGVQTEFLPRIQGVVGLEEVRQLPSFYGFGKILPPGMPLEITTDMLSRNYEVYLFHSDPEQVEYDSHRVRELIHYY
jgi:biotin carboxylase